MDNAACDSVIRIALCAMAADPTSPLSKDQRAWIIDRVQRHARLTTGERGRLKHPLLAWIDERMPQCRNIVAKQFINV